MSSAKQSPWALKGEAFVSHGEWSESGPGQGCVQGHLHKQGYTSSSLVTVEQLQRRGWALAGASSPYPGSKTPPLRPRIKGSKDWNSHPHPGCLAQVVTSPQNLLGPPQQAGMGKETFVLNQSSLLFQIILGKRTGPVVGAGPGSKSVAAGSGTQVPSLGINERTLVLWKLSPSQNSSYQGHIIPARRWAPL